MSRYRQIFSLPLQCTCEMVPADIQPVLSMSLLNVLYLWFAGRCAVAGQPAHCTLPVTVSIYQLMVSLLTVHLKVSLLTVLYL